MGSGFFCTLVIARDSGLLIFQGECSVLRDKKMEDLLVFSDGLLLYCSRTL